MSQRRVVLAGCGGMANTWIDYLKERAGAALVGLADIDPQAATAFARRHELDVPRFTDVAAAIKATEADLLMDVTVPGAHANVASTALRLGCDVLGEKPMATSMADCRQLVALAEEHGRQYAVMQNRRYIPGIRTFRSLLAGGTIGHLSGLHVDFFVGAHFNGFRTEMEHPLLMDMAIHTFDQARFISGRDPVSVYAHTFNPPGSWYQGDAAAVCVFEMTDGLIFTYRGSWCTDGAGTSWAGSWRGTGSGGTAIWDGEGLPYAEVPRPGADGLIRRCETITAPAFLWDGAHGHHGCLDEMFDALTQGRPAETDCRDNLKSMAMVFAAVESARLGEKVMIADLLGPA